MSRSGFILWFPAASISFDQGGSLSDRYLFARLGRSTRAMLLRQGQLWSDQELGDPQQGIAADSENRQERDLLPTGHLHLAHRLAIFATTEAVIDAFAHLLADEMAGITRLARIDRRIIRVVSRKSHL